MAFEGVFPTQVRTVALTIALRMLSQEEQQHLLFFETYAVYVHTGSVLEYEICLVESE